MLHFSPPESRRQPAQAACEAENMAKITVKIPLVTFRSDPLGGDRGRPRYFPGAAHRALGYKGEDLRHGQAGPWFTLEECRDWSARRVAEVEEVRAATAAGGKPDRVSRLLARPAAREAKVGFTIADVITDFTDNNPRVRGEEVQRGRRKRRPLAEGTVRIYKQSAGLLQRFDDGAVWAELADRLTGKALDGVLARFEERHGLAQTRNLRALISVAFNFGKGRTVRHNPAAELAERLPALKPDARPATVAEFLHLVAVFDCLGRADVADLAVCGAFTCQRPADRLSLTESQLRPDGILFEPHKKAASAQRLLIPVARLYAARLAAARARRRSWTVQPLNVHVSEHTKRPWAVDWFSKNWRVLRHAAATGHLERYPAGHKLAGQVTRDAALILRGVDITARLAKAGLKAMPSVADIDFKHMRDTGLEWLRDAGADDFERGAFGGHAYAFAGREIQRHYLTVPPKLAVAGMAKLETWFAAQQTAGQHRDNVPS